MPLALLTRAAHAISAAEGPGDALAAALAAIRTLSGATGAAILRADNGQLVPAAADGLDLPQRPMDELSLLSAAPGSALTSYPLVHAGSVEGILVVDGLDTSASAHAALPALLDLAAGALHNSRLLAQAQQDAQDLKAALSEVRRVQDQVIQQERLRALGEMASGIAHDFNNALAPVVGFSELLLAVPANLKDPVKARHYLEMINAGAQDAAAVVGRLREFYRQRDDSDVPEAVDVAATAQQVIQFTEPRWRDQAQAESRTVRVDTAFQPVPPAAARPSELRELLTNLVFNAVDALPDGGTITLSCHLDAPDGVPPRVALSVRDTGTGMPEDVRLRCLEPFFTTKGQAGTGLGLSMVFGTVRRWGGDMTIHSAPGEGTTVTLFLPAFDASLATAPRSSVAAPPSRALNVLVVDDEPAVREVTTACLVTDGHTVTPAAGGRAALIALRDSHFDLVVTDRAMPEMSGDQLAAMVKQIAPALPVIMLTGFGELMRARGESPPGVDVLVAKPVTLATLRTAMRQALPAPAHL